MLLSIDHNAGLVSEEALLSDISFVIVHRLVNKLEQSVHTDESGAERYHMTLTVLEGGNK